MILRTRFLVTMEGPSIEGGAVVVAGGRIVEAGSFSEVRAKHSGKVVDLGDYAVLPGLINTHCHLDYTCLRHRLPPASSFTDWILSINAAKAALTPNDYVASINQGFIEAKRFGTVALANLTAFPELIPQVDPLIQTTWFAELIDVRRPLQVNAMVDRAVDQLQSASHAGLSPHAPFTASKELYQRCAATAAARGLRLTTHLAESREEMAMFREGAASLFDFMRETGRDPGDCGQRTPLAHFLSMTDPAQPWLLAHLNELSESDFQLLAATRPPHHVVHCPRSHKYFGHSAFPFARLRALGFNISLGTDSLASNDDLSMFAEMRQFQQTYPEIAPAEILGLATRHSAAALGQSDQLGRVAPGCSADLIAVPFDGPRENLMAAIIAFEGEPMVNLWGQASEN